MNCGVEKRREVTSVNRIVSVYISYNREHAGWMALTLHRALTTDHTLDAFLDADVGPGPLDEGILAKIRDCTHFCMVLTPAALEKYRDPASWVRQEYAAAKNAATQPVIFPVYDGEPQDCIQRLQRIDASFANELAPWNIFCLRKASLDQDINRIARCFSAAAHPRRDRHTQRTQSTFDPKV